MPRTLSAVDAVSPAFNQTKRELFQPFRLSFWARMAVVALTTGEFSTLGGWGGGDFSIPTVHTGRRGSDFIQLPRIGWELWHRLLPFLPVVIVLLLIFSAIWVYTACVFRFILFDSVLTGRCNIKEGWRRWSALGASYFLWKVGFGLVTLLVMGVAIGGPLWWAYAAGVFRNPREHILLLALGGAGLFLILMFLLLMSAVVSLFAKDFLIPVMALENVRALEGWRRFLPMLRDNKNAYTGYVLMKIVLAVGSAILFGVVTLIALLVLFIPLGIAGATAFLFVKGAALSWNFYTFSACVILGAAVLSLVLYVCSFVSTPEMIFFQSYVNHFLGSRYPPLGALVFPAPLPTGGSSSQ